MIVPALSGTCSPLSAPSSSNSISGVGVHGTIADPTSVVAGWTAHGQRSRALRNFLLAALVLLTMVPVLSRAQSLQVTYGAKAVQSISFGGVTLEDVGANPADAFHIWHMKATDLQGNVANCGQCGWGEVNSGSSWNAGTQTETYYYSWGSIQTQFVQQGNNLNMVVTETNYAGSGIIFDGAEIYPFALHFPTDPKNFNGYSQYAITTTGPGVSAADFGAGVVTSVIPDETTTMYGGWKNAGANTYSPMMSTTAPDGLASFFPRIDRAVQPGTSFTYTVALRFTPEGTAADASDAYTSFAATYPSQMTWTDRRIIGTAYLASSPANSGDITQSGGFPTNPRRYFADPSVDVTTPAGLRAFQDRVLATAAANVNNAQATNSQGVITWDIEGEQYPQDTSYVCSPDQIGAVAPEMESAVMNPNSAFYGQRLDDAYFRTITSAGLKAGVCLRPQMFTLAGNGTARQITLTGNNAIIANLENKAKIANSRWGATIFYVDSTVDVNGGTLDPAIFQQLITDFPAFLFIPEESTPRYYAYSAPFYSFLFHTDLGTDASVYKYYPNAFGANLINDVAPSLLVTYTPQLIQSVAKGDILMGHVDYWQANDPTLIAIYQAAGKGSLPVMQVTPSVQWSTPAAIPYGTALSAAQLNASASTTGTFVYTPSLGTVLNAGTYSLLATFTPTDTKDYTLATGVVNLTVTQATPTVSWAAPAAISQGTPLSAAQLNATANVPGVFTYSPAAGAILGSGTSSLQVTFTPADTTDYSVVNASVSLTVTPKGQTTPTVNWGTPAAITYGTVLSGAQLNATASVPGTFSYSPTAGSLLGAGFRTLQVTFTPADAVSYSSVSKAVAINVQQATPTVTWFPPAAITSGTALSAAQLNASANVAGTFVYSPAAGTVLPIGLQVLSATFIPSDATDYVSVPSSVPLAVLAAAVIPTGPLYIASPNTGAVVSGVILISEVCNLPLDAAGTFLLIDGQGYGRFTSGPFIYVIDTRTLSNGTHTLQLWAHDIGNNTTVSAPISITVQN
jgi:hypothetical protein